jgi:hypothetical protein
MIAGFTGTRKGATDAQMSTLRVLLRDAHALHHGDAIGADAQAHKLALELGILVTVHPPTNDKYRAFCTGYTARQDAAPYGVRDMDIVRACDRLYATPAGYAEELRSGTWATVRYARSVAIPITIIYPDGTVENN